MMLQIKKIAKFGLVLLTSSSLIIGTSAPAFADGGHHRDGHHFKHKKHYGGHHYRHHKKFKNYKKYRHYNRHYKRHHGHYRYGYYGRGYYGGHYGYYGHKRKHRHNTGAAILFGAAAGALIYHGISSANKHNNHGYRNVSNRDYVNPDHHYNNQWTNAQNVQPRAGQVTYTQQRSSDCMQEREYQTTITVGGNTVPAYGTACLQPDGSWKFGDPIPEPSFQ